MRRRQHGARTRALTTVPLRAAAVALGLTGLAATAACATGPATPAAAGHTAASATPGPSGTATPGNNTPGNNTTAVCQQINAAVAGDLTAFGADVGTFAGHVSGQNSTAAGKARTAAVGRLTGLAGKIRTAGQQATVPKVSDAATATATNLERLAADPGLLADVHAAADVAPVIGKVAQATDPMVSACV
jgi:hypothetical protein